MRTLLSLILSAILFGAARAETPISPIDNKAVCDDHTFKNNNADNLVGACLIAQSRALSDGIQAWKFANEDLRKTCAAQKPSTYGELGYCLITGAKSFLPTTDEAIY